MPKHFVDTSGTSPVCFKVTIWKIVCSKPLQTSGWTTNQGPLWDKYFGCGLSGRPSNSTRIDSRYDSRNIQLWKSISSIELYTNWLSFDWIWFSQTKTNLQPCLSKCFCLCYAGSVVLFFLFSFFFFFLLSFFFFLNYIQLKCWCHKKRLPGSLKMNLIRDVTTLPIKIDILVWEGIWKRWVSSIL